MKYDGTELKYQIVNKQQFIYKNGVYTKIFFKGKCYSFGQYVHPLHKIHQPPLWECLYVCMLFPIFLKTVRDSVKFPTTYVSVESNLVSWLLDCHNA